jgi:hypothetical protein
VLGERKAIVLEVKGWDVHGVGYVDVALGFQDRSVETPRLGRESIPDDLRAGEEVLVTSAMSVVVSIRRAETETNA